MQDLKSLKFFLEEGRDPMYAKDEKPGEGTYICTMCYSEIILKSNSDRLPRCPDCNATFYNEVI
ncbi:zinc ribbon-containing protein [Psychrilyobacter sp. S5]|uniref:zinc ribbon-containing protein n=1 Tax=Psychrilyobacter sp. S5 TaxID=2283384 RepID=UPI0038F68913